AEEYLDIPLFADVSRLHATLTRDTEGYLLEAARSVLVNAQAVDKALLRDGDRVTLGASFQMRFHQPVPLSASARLDPGSGHRLRLGVDAVLLMADTLILGPGAQAHVGLPDVKHPVILFRQKDVVGVRHAGPLTVDGKVYHDRALLGPAAQVVGSDFTFA